MGSLPGVTTGPLRAVRAIGPSLRYGGSVCCAVEADASLLADSSPSSPLCAGSVCLVLVAGRDLLRWVGLGARLPNRPAEPVGRLHFPGATKGSVAPSSPFNARTSTKHTSGLFGVMARLEDGFHLSAFAVLSDAIGAKSATTPKNPETQKPRLLRPSCGSSPP